ncbi:MAG: glycosyltransferase family 39 protein [bacterium]
MRQHLSRRILPWVWLCWGLSLAVVGQGFLIQANKAWTLWPGIVFYVLAFQQVHRFFSEKISKIKPHPLLSPTREVVCFFLILLLGPFFRLKGIHHYPSGIFADRAEVALGALRILHGDWHPFLSALSLHVPEIPIYYVVAGWFALLGSSPETYAYFDVVLSVSGLILAYAFFREVVSIRAALAAFFLLAVMRWNFAFAHQVYFQAQSVLFLSAALAAFYYSIRTNRIFFAMVSGAVAGTGLYAYQACKAIPLMLAACLIYEFWSDRKLFRKKSRLWLALAASFLVFAAPYLGWVAQKGELGRRDAQVSILKAIDQKGNLSPIFGNFEKQILMFNRQADNNTQADFDQHRMLDDGTGILFVLGFLYALTRLREKPFFLAAAGTLVMSLPSYLSVDAGHAGRSLGATPFVALVAALFLEAMGRRFSVGFRKVGWILGAFLFGFIAWRNYNDYFVLQASKPICQNDCSWTETRVGEIIARSNRRTEFFLPSCFYGHPTVRYLTPGQDGQIHPFDPSALPQPASEFRDRPFCFLLGDFKAGMLDYLTRQYPGGQVESLSNPLGEVSIYGYRISAQALAKLKPGQPRLTRGLQGFYAHSNSIDAKPFLICWAPLINFNFRDLPGTGTPLFIDWKGQLIAPVSGNYSLVAATGGWGEARVVIDGNRGVTKFQPDPWFKIQLSKGPHQLEVDFRQPALAISKIHLLWQRPGQKNLEFVPNRAFGRIPGS